MRGVGLWVKANPEPGGGTSVEPYEALVAQGVTLMDRA